jgi:hypothetical protein
MLRFRLRAAGFLIEAVVEPEWLKFGETYPYRDRSLLKETRHWNRVPYTIVFKAKKAG